MKQILIRVVCGCALLGLLFVAPWWLFLVACVLSAVYIDRQYELVVIGFLGDAAYGGGTGGTSMPFLFFSTTLALVVISIIVKPRLMV